MAVNPRDMDGFMPLLSTTDIKKKLNVGSALLNYLGDSSKSIECQDIGMFIDNVIPWLGNGNPKVSLLADDDGDLWSHLTFTRGIFPATFRVTFTLFIDRCLSLACPPLY